MSEETVDKVNSTIRVLIALVVVQICITLGLGYLVYSKPAAPADTTIAQAEPEAPAVPPEYMEIGPITVNLKTDAVGQHLLYTRMKLRLKDKETLEFLESNRDEIHNELLVLLSGREPSKLTSAVGKKTVADEIISMVKGYFADERPELDINGVLFQDFIVQ